MRTERLKGILPILIIVSLMATAVTTVSFLSVSQVTAAGSSSYNKIVLGGNTAYTLNGDAALPWKLYEAGDRPPVMAAKRVDNGAVVAAGLVASCRNGRWNDIDNPNPHLDNLLHQAFQWMVSGAENVLWYGETEDYIYNDANYCSQLIDNLRLKFGYAIDNTIDSAFTPITPVLLAPYDVLVIPQFELGDVGTGGNPNLLPDNVVETIENFVRDGGGLLIMEGGDTFGYNYAEVQNKILRALDMNIYFQSDTVMDNINNWGSDWEITADVDNTTGIGSTYQNSTGKTVIGLYHVSSLVSTYRVSTSISPEYQDGFPGGILSFTVNVWNLGSYGDNYILVVSENVWKAELSENRLEDAPCGDSASTTLTVTIPADAPLGAEDKITVTVTSQTENAVSDDANCIVHATSWTGSAVFSLVDLYTVNVEKILDLGQGSKLVVKFYTYGDAFENENVIDNFSPPWQVEENESAWNPEGIGVKKAKLDLTIDNTENVISTIASFTVRKIHLEIRFTEIPLEWALAENKVPLEIEFSEIPMYWALAPP